MSVPASFRTLIRSMQLCVTALPPVGIFVEFHLTFGTPRKEAQIEFERVSPYKTVKTFSGRRRPCESSSSIFHPQCSCSCSGDGVHQGDSTCAGRRTPASSGRSDRIFIGNFLQYTNTIRPALSRSERPNSSAGNFYGYLNWWNFANGHPRTAQNERFRTAVRRAVYLSVALVALGYLAARF